MPRPLQKPVNRQLRPQEAEPSEMQNVRRLRSMNAVPMGQKNAETPPGPLAPSCGRTIESARPVRKLRNANAVPVSQNIAENSPVAPSYGQNGFFVGWVPNRQNRSLTDEMASSPPQNDHIPGPRDTWDPKQGSLGPHLACKHLWSGGI